MRIRELAENQLEGVYLYKDTLRHIFTLRKPGETCSLYMAIVLASGKTITTGELADILHWKLSRVRRVVRRLKKAGLLLLTKPGLLNLLNLPGKVRWPGFLPKMQNNMLSSYDSSCTKTKTCQKNRKKNSILRRIQQKKEKRIYQLSKRYIPNHLKKKTFLRYWRKWIKYRADIHNKKPYRVKTTIKFQLRKLGHFTKQEACAMIQQSMEQGWTGLFPVKVNYRASTALERIPFYIPDNIKETVVHFIKRITGGGIDSLDEAEKNILMEILQSIKWYYIHLPGEQNAGSLDRGKNKYFITSWTSFARKYFEFLLDHAKKSPIHFYKVRSNSWNWFIRTLGERYSISFETKGKEQDED